MAISNVISDLVLTAASCWALWLCAKSPQRGSVGAWALFFIPLALAAFFGALRFADVPYMYQVSSIFQLLVITLGSCGLLFGIYQLVFSKSTSINALMVVSLIGTMLFVVVLQGRGGYIQQLFPLISMLLVAILSFIPLAQGRWLIGVRLLAGVGLAAVATWLQASLDNRTLAIDGYHYLLGLCVISFGWAAGDKKEPATN